MAKLIEAPDGSVIEFPSDMDDSAIAAVMRRTYPSKQAPQTKTAGLPTGAGFAALRQNASLDTRQPPSSAKPQPTMGTGEDVARSLGSGMVRGVMGMAAIPGTVEWLGRKGLSKLGAGVSEETALPTFGDFKTAYEGVAGPMHEPQTQAGKYARTIGDFSTGMLFPGGVAQKVLGNVVAPAVASETAGQLTEGTAAEPWARVAGGMVGGMLPSLGTRAVSPVTGGGNVRQQHVRNLEREGVTALTAGQKTGSKPLKWHESAIGDMPFTGQRASQLLEQQAEQFTRAALKRAGVESSRADPATINRAFQEIGQKFDAVAKGAMINVPPGMHERLQSIAAQYDRMVPPASRVPFVREMAESFPPGMVLAGPQALAWRSELSSAMRSAKADPHMQRALGDMLEVLDTRIARALSKDQRALWQTAKGEYRNLLAIERAVAGAGEGAAMGLISPSQLRNAVKTLHGQRNYARGRGDLANLARSGEAIMKPLPNSGTAPRAGAHALLTLGGSAVGNFPGAVAAFAAPSLAGRALMSRPVQSYLANQAAVPLREATRPGKSFLSQTPAATMQVPLNDAAEREALIRALRSK